MDTESDAYHLHIMLKEDLETATKSYAVIEARMHSEGKLSMDDVKTLIELHRHIVSVTNEMAQNTINGVLQQKKPKMESEPEKDVTMSQFNNRLLRLESRHAALHQRVTQMEIREHAPPPFGSEFQFGFGRGSPMERMPSSDRKPAGRGDPNRTLYMMGGDSA
jgi:hypothetical protein